VLDTLAAAVADGSLRPVVDHRGQGKVVLQVAG
jgi:hypothetical protein